MNVTSGGIVNVVSFILAHNATSMVPNEDTSSLAVEKLALSIVM